MDIISGLNLAIETLQQLNIPSTKDNMDKLLGSIQLLENIRDTLNEMSRKAQQEKAGQPEQTQDDPVPVEVEEIHPGE